MNKLIVLAKKYGVTVMLVIAVGVLSVSHLQLQKGFNSSKNKVLAYDASNSSTAVEDTNDLIKRLNSPHNVDPNIPAVNCGFRLQLMPSSTVYEPNPDFDVSFLGTDYTNQNSARSFFQDINGDNLPDYIFSNGVASGGPNYEVTSVNHTSCVYLNDGSGFVKAYECLAYTIVNTETGNVVTARYSGDCAGTSSVGVDDHSENRNEE